MKNIKEEIIEILMNETVYWDENRFKVADQILSLILEALPKEKEVRHPDKSGFYETMDFKSAGFNQCLAEIKSILKS